MTELKKEVVGAFHDLRKLEGSGSEASSRFIEALLVAKEAELVGEISALTQRLREENERCNVWRVEEASPRSTLLRNNTILRHFAEEESKLRQESNVANKY